MVKYQEDEVDIRWDIVQFPSQPLALWALGFGDVQDRPIS
jgi:hypothetical protein